MLTSVKTNLLRAIELQGTDELRCAMYQTFRLEPETVGWNWENTATRRSGPLSKTKTSKLVAHTSARLLTFDTDADAEPRSCASCDLADVVCHASFLFLQTLCKRPGTRQKISAQPNGVTSAHEDEVEDDEHLES